ncbi:MAG: ATP-binding cassette domain-containing protein, partial [Thermoguttaceae bacterium]
DVSMDIMRGQRWGILGPNGCGKTTLLRCLLGQLEADAGQVMLGQGVKVGYFDQHLSSVADDTQVVDAVRPDHKEFNEQRRRDLLARFGLTGDTALQQVNKLSGGERCRAALARLAAADANLLVLDEPTNHLDLWARDALERSLRNFDGTVLFVSHDRYFVNQVADHLIVVEPGRFRVLEGNYAAYLEWVQSGFIQPGADAGKAKPTAKTSSKPAAKPSSKPSRDGAAGTPARTKRRFPYRKVEDIEQEILDRETRIEEFHLLLATPETLRDGERVRQLKAQLAAAQETLEQLYAHWEEAVELNW